MPDYLGEMFAHGSLLQITGLLGLGLFFVMVGLKDLADDRPEGYLYLTIALFLAIAHAVILDNLISTVPNLAPAETLTIWLWLVTLFAPALIGLFVARSLFNFAISQGRNGLVKLFFGLTLVCYIYMVGANWPMDVRGILTVVWSTFFFKSEMAIAS